jgi:adenylosuccinate synthase
MKTVAVVGTQWGDEGKGKIVDLLAADADVVVRFQGGNNAAHTLVVDGEKFILRLIPAGALHPGKVCVIGNGTVVDPIALAEELAALRARGRFTDNSLLKLSCDAHMVMPYHRAIDRARETRAGERAIGTTGFGIGPAYEDKMARVGLRFDELNNFARFREKLTRNIADKNVYLRAVLKAKTLKGPEIVDQMKRVRPRMLPYLCDTGAYLAEAIAAGKRVLFEGAQAVLLDIDHGNYPYVTSSNTVAGQAAAGSGIGPKQIGYVLGIVKAYTTRVGEGPFPTEQDNEIGEKLGTRGSEFGTVTGRKRRCGWFDAMLVKQTVVTGGVDGIVLTKLDILDAFEKISVCIGYELDGKRIDYLPADANEQARLKPVYEIMEGWHSSTRRARSWANLPARAVKYVRRIEELIGAPVAMLSTSPEREDTILVRDPFLG